MTDERKISFEYFKNMSIIRNIALHKYFSVDIYHLNISLKIFFINIFWIFPYYRNIFTSYILTVWLWSVEWQDGVTIRDVSRPVVRLQLSVLTVWCGVVWCGERPQWDHRTWVATQHRTLRLSVSPPQPGPILTSNHHTTLQKIFRVWKSFETKKYFWYSAHTHL